MGCLLFGLLLSGMAHAQDICPTNPVENATACTFNARDYTLDPVDVEIHTTCRAVTDHLYVFVQDSIWNDGTVTPVRLAAALDAFESAVPAFPQAGIYAKVTEILGFPPNQFDNNDHIYLIVQDISTSSINPTSVYIRSEDLEKDFFGDPVEGSNQHETIFLHGEQLESDERLSDLANGLSQLVQWGFDADEDPWVVDTIARQMALHLGYTAYLTPIGDFAHSPDASLRGDDSTGRVRLDHGATALFGVYVVERLGELFPYYWAIQGDNDAGGFEAALAMMGTADGNFCDYLHDWVIRNKLNRGEYAYDSLDLPIFTGSYIRQHPGQLSRPVGAYAGSYVEIHVEDARPGETLEIHYQIPDTTGIRVSVAKTSSTDGSRVELEELRVLAGQPTIYLFDDIDEGFDRILFMSSRCAPGSPLNYQIDTELIPPETDGDEELESGEVEEGEGGDGDFSETEESDGDLTGDGDMDAEEEEEIKIYGSKTCPEINACYSACDTAVCRENCVAQGTPQGQAEWDEYITCITGTNPEGKDCLSYEEAGDRLACMRRNCHEWVEACTEAEEEPPSKGGGGCRNANGPHPNMLIWLVYLGFLVRRRFRGRPDHA